MKKTASQLHMWYPCWMPCIHITPPFNGDFTHFIAPPFTVDHATSQTRIAFLHDISIDRYPISYFILSWGARMKKPWTLKCIVFQMYSNYIVCMRSSIHTDVSTLTLKLPECQKLWTLLRRMPPPVP